MVALDGEVTLRGKPEVRELPELARRDLRLPVRARKLIFDDLPAVEPVLDVRAVDDDACLVPLAVWLDDSCGRRVQPEVGGGRGQPVLAVRCVGVVEELVLRRAPKDVFV